RPRPLLVAPARLWGPRHCPRGRHLGPRQGRRQGGRRSGRRAREPDRQLAGAHPEGGTAAQAGATTTLILPPDPPPRSSAAILPRFAVASRGRIVEFPLAQEGSLNSAAQGKIVESPGRGGNCQTSSAA